MKRFIYIAVVAVGFLAVSCSKETIKPTAQNDQDVPVWKSASDGNSDNDNSGGGITDPNNDKDESSKKKS